MSEKQFDVYNSMAENSPVTNIINELLNDRIVYVLEKLNNKVVEFEPMTEGFWKDSIRFFLIAAVYYLKENCKNTEELCYSAVLDFTTKAQQMTSDELNAVFCNLGEDSESCKYYMAFLENSQKCSRSIITSATMQLKKIYFDKQRIAEFEKVFEV